MCFFTFQGRHQCQMAVKVIAPVAGTAASALGHKGDLQLLDNAVCAQGAPYHPVQMAIVPARLVGGERADIVRRLAVAIFSIRIAWCFLPA